jgi:DNA-binding Xre family transcriptional regulator
MRIRLPELFEERGLTAYAVAQQSDGRISTSVLYRLLRNGGKARYLDAELLDALCDVLGVAPNELLEREGKRRRGK